LLKASAGFRKLSQRQCKPRRPTCELIRVVSPWLIVSLTMGTAVTDTARKPRYVPTQTMLAAELFVAASGCGLPPQQSGTGRAFAASIPHVNG
jgi:hypothetical protein